MKLQIRWRYTFSIWTLFINLDQSDIKFLFLHIILICLKQWAVLENVKIRCQDLLSDCDIEHVSWC